MLPNACTCAATTHTTNIFTHFKTKREIHTVNVKAESLWLRVQNWKVPAQSSTATWRTPPRKLGAKVAA